MPRKAKIEKPKCQCCLKTLRPIDADWVGRKYHKECFKYGHIYLNQYHRMIREGFTGEKLLQWQRYACEV